MSSIVLCLKADCFANTESKSPKRGLPPSCTCLTDNNFKGECPFYKTKEIYKEERKKVKERLRGLKD